MFIDSRLWGFSIEHELADSYFQAVNYEDDSALGFVPLLRLLRLHREDAKGAAEISMYCTVPRPANWIEWFGQTGCQRFCMQDVIRRVRDVFEQHCNDELMIKQANGPFMTVCLKCRWIFDALYFLVHVLERVFHPMKSAQQLFCVVILRTLEERLKQALTQLDRRASVSIIGTCLQGALGAAVALSQVLSFQWKRILNPAPQS